MSHLIKLLIEMLTKKTNLTNFTRAVYSQSDSIRPDTEQQLIEYMRTQNSRKSLTRGAGLSYSDCCLHQDGLIIDSSRLNHLMHFDVASGIVTCQPAVTFKDLLLLHQEYIPPVIPGTLKATIAGGIANDIHGKNNHQEGSLAHHIKGLTLLTAGQVVHCNQENYSDLFEATLAGLGLTGTILRIELQLKKASRAVQVTHQKHDSLESLIQAMSTDGLRYDYQVAWLDLLHHIPRGILSLANHVSQELPAPSKKKYTVPKQPISLVKKWNIRLFNQLYFHKKANNEVLHIEEFNNPLDQIDQWNCLYGSRGLIQFQAVFPQEKTIEIINHLLLLIKKNKATPTLAVLKLLTRSGPGLLSFCQPGFTLAIDFIHNAAARQTILQMNEFIAQQKARIYLAKDLLLTPEQYQRMYEQHQEFSKRIKKYNCMMHSDLARRLGIIE